MLFSMYHLKSSLSLRLYQVTLFCVLIALGIFPSKIGTVHWFDVVMSVLALPISSMRVRRIYVVAYRARLIVDAQ